MTPVKYTPAAETPTQIWDRNWMEYGNMMAANFKGGKLTFESLAKVQSFRNCLLNTYSVLVKYEMCDKLETASEGVKEDLRELLREHKGDMNKVQMLEFSKCVMAIEVLLKD